MQPILLVTTNDGKAREVEALLGLPVERLALDIPEIQSLDVAEVVRAKAETAYDRVGRPLIVEDTGLAIDALGGLPGALVRWFLATIGPAGIAMLIPTGADRGATARTAIALHDGASVSVFIGETRGTIVAGPRGDRGFGWDPIFQPDGSPRTFAEMDEPEKHRYSMRRAALDRVRERLDAGG